MTKVELFDGEGYCDVCGAHFHEHSAKNMAACATQIVDIPGEELEAAFVKLIEFRPSPIKE